MGAAILQGNVFDVLPTIEPGSIDCAVTSPPYWMLRSYLPKGHALKSLELGSEPTPAAFVANMVRVFALVRECLADHGTCWLNMGDSYSTGVSGSRTNLSTLEGRPNAAVTAAGEGRKNQAGIAEGNLCLIPWRLALALQDDGWLVRSIVVWHKPAPMPASLAGWMWKRCRVKVRPGWGANGTAPHPGTLNGGSARVPNSGGKKTAGVAEWSDCPGCTKCEPHGGYILRRGSWRPTSSWEPVLMLAKRSGYYADGEAVKQPPSSATVSRDQYTRVLDDPDEQFAVRHDHETVCDGANLRNVWTIAAEPLSEKHYAAFPTELVHRCLKAGTSARGYCPACGAPWARVIEPTADTAQAQALARNGQDWTARGWDNGDKRRGKSGDKNNGGYTSAYVTQGWRQTCPCPPHEPRPGRVLDPFAGSGRTGIEALMLGLDFTGVELNPEYADMARRLLRDESPLFA